MITSGNVDGDLVAVIGSHLSGALIKPFKIAELTERLEPVITNGE